MKGSRPYARSIYAVGRLILVMHLLHSHAVVAKSVSSQESFCYDDLARLTTALDSESVCQNHFRYDSLGNISNKHDLIYTYHDLLKPNQLVDLQQSGQPLRRYQYDALGNQIQAKYENGPVYQGQQWTAFGKPWMMTRRIEANQYNSTEISYNPEYKRIHRRDYKIQDGLEQLVEIQYIGGGLFEQIEQDQQTISYRHSIAKVATYQIESGQAGQSGRLTYQHKDHIGSIVAESDNIGQYETIKQARLNLYRYDAWGAAVKHDAADTSESLFSQNTLRGFTEHEMLDTVSLIHMNGRVYDPELGRFISADPFIQAPDHTQSFNRYAYVWNNPLSMTDPTGYISAKDDFYVFRTTYDQTKSWSENWDQFQGVQQAQSRGVGYAVSAAAVAALSAWAVSSMTSFMVQYEIRGEAINLYVGAPVMPVLSALDIHDIGKAGATLYRYLAVDSPKVIDEIVIQGGKRADDADGLVGDVVSKEDVDKIIEKIATGDPKYIELLPKDVVKTLPDEIQGIWYELQIKKLESNRATDIEDVFTKQPSDTDFLRIKGDDIDKELYRLRNSPDLEERSVVLPSNLDSQKIH